MNMNASEIRYFERRIRSTLEMAKACNSLCGRKAHMALAGLYTLKVKELQAILSPAPATHSAAPRASRQKWIDRSIAKDVPLTMSNIAVPTRKKGTLSMVEA
jgi:hypothetical protein